MMTRQQIAKRLDKIGQPYGLSVRVARGWGYLISSPRNYKAYKVRETLAAFVNERLESQVQTWQGYIDGRFPHIDGEAGVQVLREVMRDVVPALREIEKAD